MEFLSPDCVFDGVMRVVDTASANLHFSLSHSCFHQSDSPLLLSFFNAQRGSDKWTAPGCVSLSVFFGKHGRQFDFSEGDSTEPIQPLSLSP